MRNVLLVGLIAGVLAGCGALSRTLPSAPLPARALVTTPALAVDGRKVHPIAFTNRYMEISGEAGAVTGDGVWVSLGTHEKPDMGWESPSNPDGSFLRVVDFKPLGETVTLWAFHDEGDKRLYSAPVVLPIQPNPGKPRIQRRIAAPRRPR